MLNLPIRGSLKIVEKIPRMGDFFQSEVLFPYGRAPHSHRTFPRKRHTTVSGIHHNGYLNRRKSDRAKDPR